MNNIVSICFLSAFVLGMLAIGLVSYKKANSVNGFLLGGRKIGPWMSAFAYGTSYFSAVIFIGYAGKTGWQIGLGGAMIGIGNALLGSLLAWLVLAKRTRAMTHKLNAKTMPEFFASRFDSRPLKAVAACIIFIFLVPYSASVYMGLGYLLDAVLPGIRYEYCMLFIAVVTALYLVLGGYVAASRTDFIQGIIMIVGVILMVVFIVNAPEVGGVAQGVDSLRAIDENLVKAFGGANFTPLMSTILLTSFGTWGLPQMVHKFYAIKDDKAIKKAIIISTAFALIISTSAYFVGAFGRLFLDNQLPAEGYDAVMPAILVQAMSDGIGGTIVLNIIILLVLSASMSTLSSIVLTSSSAISIDLIQGYIKPNISKKASLFSLRALCLTFIAVSLLIALLKPAFIMTLMSFSWGTVSGAFIGPFILGLYNKKANKIGAWSGMVLGLGTCLVFTVIYRFSAEIAPLMGVISMIVSVVASFVGNAVGNRFILKGKDTAQAKINALMFAKEAE